MLVRFLSEKGLMSRLLGKVPVVGDAIKGGMESAAGAKAAQQAIVPNLRNYPTIAGTAQRIAEQPKFIGWSRNPNYPRNE